MKTLHTELRDHISAGFSGLWVHTHEPDQAEREIIAMAHDQEWTVVAWDMADGFHMDGDQGKNDPLAPLNAAHAWHQKKGDTAITILHNFHKYLTNPTVMQKLFNTVIEGKPRRTFLVVLSCTTMMPPEIEKVFTIIKHELPTHEQLRNIALELEVPNPPQQAIEAAAGLTRYESEGAFALSLARDGELKANEIWALKESTLKRAGTLTLHRGTTTFKDLGGLYGLKDFCTRALRPRTGASAKPRGILLLGIPGTGKSAFAKSLGNETSRPTLDLDIGSLFGSLVGQTEERVRHALDTADAMAPCILFVDEIEKAFSGVGGSGDSGVSTRMFGSFLTWMNDHESDVFFIATCNDISKLPPEFSRAERFDAIFFIDTPSEDDRAGIWKLYQKAYGVKDSRDTAFDDSTWTGAEIKACCRLAALLDTNLQEASQKVVPVAATAGDKIQALRQWAANRCVDAATGTVYREPQSKLGARRGIERIKA